MRRHHFSLVHINGATTTLVWKVGMHIKRVQVLFLWTSIMIGHIPFQFILLGFSHVISGQTKALR
jgi:hypothetical protein